MRVTKNKADDANRLLAIELQGDIDQLLVKIEQESAQAPKPMQAKKDLNGKKSLYNEFVYEPTSSSEPKDERRDEECTIEDYDI